ncbi:UDP-N-acetylglucosamine--N-acetylmuramyl-(pentapeptide) pyrophosphoryl-undecaprenol N-acetylglucosamine transferase [Sulfurimonas sp. HSL3-7]|uniref:UDP-N-acetylglucosamine--N-acetylmuramyl- (pentapeptide) pyrophosphoryl-undecaprenol N-acetylglucosamine transferase n=1 Tax=Sulfonitrofixus jiaomeiensis TaxID=3131938 RepID=UPI0031F789CB
MRVAITGGGTGGHLAIAAALLEALKQKGHEAIYIGSVSGQDRAWFGEETRFEKRFFLDTSGVVNRRYIGKLWALWKIFRAVLKSRSILKNEKIDAVVSVGGYSAAAATFGAYTKHIPFFIHEQNAVMGRLNAMMKPYARAFYSSYDEKSPVKGYPVRDLFFETAHLRKKINTVIFLGGSQGAKFINDLALETSAACIAKGIKVIHQCGERDYERVKKAYEEQKLEVELYSFTKELPALIERADLAVSRAGASTLWELAANGLPALFVPYPYAAGDHQYHNALFLVEKALAWSYRESPSYARNLLALLDDDLEEKSRGLMKLGNKGAAAAIIDDIEERLDVS